MKIIINTDCIGDRYSLGELLFILMIREGFDPRTEYNNLLQKDVIIEEEDKVSVFRGSVDELERILFESNTTKQNKENLTDFYHKLAELFPPGIKSGTNSRWRGNPTDTIRKLGKFFEKYGSFTQDEVFEATKTYVDRFKHDTTKMRTLPYFILKNDEYVAFLLLFIFCNSSIIFILFL